MKHIRHPMLIMTALCVLAVSLAFNSGAVHAQTNNAHIRGWKICRDLNLSGNWWQPDVDPHVTLLVCYDGSHIWQNGPVTAGVNTLGYVLDDISWSGTYNSGGTWIGTGENYRVTIWGGWASFSCASRWMIDAWGNTFSYNRGS